MFISAFAAQSATDDLNLHKIERRAPRPDDVTIEILYCGVCHTDLHQARNHGGFTRYPIVPGHEIIGRVSAVGKDVVRFATGDIVGVGCMVDSCQHCKQCFKGYEQYCKNTATYTYNSHDRYDGTPTYGGYSQEIVVSDKFVLNIPQNLPIEGVAPLLCAGITTWEPLTRWNVTKDSRVGVVGLGGLGHIALKLAKAFGAEVTLFTHSPGKEEDAKRLGADHIILSTDDDEMQKAAKNFDLIIDTVPYDHDVNPYLTTLAVKGTMVMVGYTKPLSQPVQAGLLAYNQRALAGSFIGGVKATQDMLDFCGKHNIVSDIELIPIQKINEAYERLLKSDVKYRFVIDIASLKETNNVMA